MSNKLITELLSPAGDWDCLRAAISNGADAVYLGTKEFNARMNTRNFSLEELGKVVDYAHERGVRVYLTLNTLVKNHELPRFFNVLARAYTLGIDGVIIQHISFLEIIKRGLPGLKVFISTQAAIGNSASASLVKQADRVILPRELSLDEIKRIIAAGVSAEVFVHGALCFSYSGLCLFSSFVSGRSGNRGSCAQLCRQKYNGSYPLSTRELCLADRIPELIEAGISGFKIEGRMRSPLYVAVATRLYRKAIDAYLAGKPAVPEKEMSEIEVVFNREFTGGFVGGRGDLISPEKPMNRGAYLGVMKNGEIAVQRAVAVGDGVGIWHKNGITGTFIKEMTSGGRKVDSAAAGDRVNLDLDAKDSARIYLTSSTRIGVEPDFTIDRPQVIMAKRHIAGVSLPETTPFANRAAPRLLVKEYSLKQAEESIQSGADMAFYDIFAPDFPANGRLGAYLPRIMNDADLSRAMELVAQKRPAAILTGNLGLLSRRAAFKVPIYLDYCFNAFNDIDLRFFRQYKVTPILSPELTLQEMTQLKDKDVAVFCQGDVVLVNTLIELTARRLVDAKGLSFPVRREHAYWQILNSCPFGLFNDVRRLRAAGFSQFFIDQAGKGPYLAKLYRGLLAHETPDRRLRKGHTSGHLYRPVM